MDDIKDLLDHTDHNPDSAGQQAAGASAGAAMKTQLEGIASGVASAGFQTVALSLWLITLRTRRNGTPWQVDINPLSHASVAGFAARLRNAVISISTFLYVMACYGVVHEALLFAPSARQAQSASAVPAASSGFALIAAPLITVALAAIPAVFVSFMGAGGYLNVINANPFGGGDSAIQMGVSLAAAFLPLETILSHILLFFVFKIKAGAVYWLASTIVRFIVG